MKYEISKLINQVIGRDKDRKREVILKLGYKNLSRGFRRLFHLIETGKCEDTFRRKLPVALNIDTESIEIAFKQTEKQLALEAKIANLQDELYFRKIFKPHLWITHERYRPSSIAMVALSGLNSYKLIELPENILLEGWIEQLRIVGECIRKHNENDFNL